MKMKRFDHILSFKMLPDRVTYFDIHKNIQFLSHNLKTVFANCVGFGLVALSHFLFIFVIMCSNLLVEI